MIKKIFPLKAVIILRKDGIADCYGKEVLKDSFIKYLKKKKPKGYIYDGEWYE